MLWLNYDSVRIPAGSDSERAGITLCMSSPPGYPPAAAAAKPEGWLALCWGTLDALPAGAPPKQGYHTAAGASRQQRVSSGRHL
jgi:hypothetical protein